ncbi:MAG: hypothetical protein Ct9H300mP13_6220 [Gammaproteobacteria bacterium]|nr:MAG: hypothetical protein Ct9H300mP13_6220 [Gammaproteobacteria bacterium]
MTSHLYRADVLQMSVWSEIEPLPTGMPIVQIGLRDGEMGKNYPSEIALRSDVGVTLRVLVPMLQDKIDAKGHSRCRTSRVDRT